MGTVSNPIRKALDKVALWARINSPWVVHFNSGSCNGCDIEILATLAPRWDLERFGVKLWGSPRHADILMCTGPVSRQARERLIRVYEQMPSPKFVIAVGSCGITGGAFHACYNIVGDIGDVIPVDVYIPGCPPRPEAIIDGVVQLLTKLKTGAAPKPAALGPRAPKPAALGPAAPEPAAVGSTTPEPASPKPAGAGGAS